MNTAEKIQTIKNKNGASEEKWGKQWNVRDKVRTQEKEEGVRVEGP